MTEQVISLRPFDPDATAAVVKMFTARDLQGTTFPPIKYVVDGYVVEGLTILGGKPKLGKSWMVLDWSLAVACGGHAFGTIECEPGDVLYAALEDNQRRLQGRVHQIMGDVTDWPERLTFTTSLPRLNEGGLDELEIWRQSVSDARLIVLDTFGKVRPQSRGTENSYDADYAALAPLQQWASEHGVAVVIVHHLRKMDADDPLDQISGTTGLTGAADSIIVVSRDSAGVTIYGRGRDIDNIEVAAQHNPITGVWSILGDADEVHQSEIRRDLKGLLQNNETGLTPRDLAELCDHSSGAIRKALGRMVKAGELIKAARGRYVLPVAYGHDGGEQ